MRTALFDTFMANRQFTSNSLFMSKYLRGEMKDELVQAVGHGAALAAGLEPAQLLHVPPVQPVDLLPGQQGVVVAGGRVRHHVPACVQNQ